MTIFKDFFNALVRLSAKSQNFPDGSSITYVDRDEFLYRNANGNSVLISAFVSGPPSDFDRIIQKDSIKKWMNPDIQNEIAEHERDDIINKLILYRGFQGLRVGIGENKFDAPKLLSEQQQGVQ